ncbi:hypothetical protein BMS3Abin11_01273 [bacterium BMS3Abin11]|nr:hypothetical protein BMS3Abin11_01273 [bacterium BMS3Abin11]
MAMLATESFPFMHTTASTTLIVNITYTHKSPTRLISLNIMNILHYNTDNSNFYDYFTYINL